MSLLYLFIFGVIIFQVSSQDTEQQINDDALHDLKDETCTRDACIKRKENFDLEDTQNDENLNEQLNSKELNEDLAVTGDTDTEEDWEDTDIEFKHYDFPPLSRIDPGNVGDIVDIELEEGKFYKRITRSVNPPIFEIPNYLSKKESNAIISSALNNGLERSGVLGADIEDERKEAGDLSLISRVSEQTWLDSETMPLDIWKTLVRRLSKLIQLPEEQIELSEQMQVVSYVRGGHYHTHLDSTDTTDKLDLPCCIQAPKCLEVDLLSEDYEKCCRICRYITVLYYLNQVEEGGETAFPLADMSDDLFQEKIQNREFQAWNDLSNFCYNASVRVTPKRGSAIMWYNHFRDENEYLGHVDERSNHGGCDILKGTKWIANNWISATNFRDRHTPSIKI